jgi:NADP-dependent alcohol dehydrogenase
VTVAIHAATADREDKSMQNFTFCNPVKVVFGKGTIAELPKLLAADAKVMMTYGGGSIKRNGVYDQVVRAMQGRGLIEFGGIEANPRYETCMKAAELARKEKVNFLLAVGGGSVLDATKFIAVAAVYKNGDPWEVMADWSRVPADLLPLGSVLTLPATGSEMNASSVISRESTNEKLFFINPLIFPRFAILDPETTFSLPTRQTANGIVDTFVHTTEQYLTYPADMPLQDRQAEGILLTLVEEAPKVMADPRNYAARANLMWCATQALNCVLACGTPQDWATHIIGHEFTALYGIDHAKSLALVWPGLMQHQRKRKGEKLLQMGSRLWGLNDGSEDSRIDRTIAKTEEFFHSLGVGTRFSDYKIPHEAVKLVAKRLADRGVKVGEHADLGQKEVEEILTLRK